MMADDEGDTESILKSSTRYRDSYRRSLLQRNGGDEYNEREMARISREYAHERLLGVAMEALIIGGRLTFSDFYAILLNHLVWLDDRVLVYLFTHTKGGYKSCYDVKFDTYKFKAGDEEIILAVHSQRRGHDTDRWVNQLCHLLGTSTESMVSIEGPFVFDVRGLPTVSVAGLSLLVATHQNLKVVTLKSMSLIEEICQFVDAASTIGVDFELNGCDVRSTTAATILLKSVRNNRGPIKMYNAKGLDPELLLEALHDNTKLKMLRIHIDPQDSLPRALNVSRSIRVSRS